MLSGRSSFGSGGRILSRVALSAEFTDRRLVAAYDALNPYEPGTQPDFYLTLAQEIRASTVIEVGCGTGLVSTHLARAGVDVLGLDPSERMLAVARDRPGRDRVRWLLGDVSQLVAHRADMVFMAGHVAQFFIADEVWHDALTAIHGALRPGGTFAFESRNPQLQAWKSWTPSRTRRTVIDPALGPIETWVAEANASCGIVETVARYRFADSGDVLTARTSLRFRSLTELDESLSVRGFTVENVYGAWDRRPLSDRDEEIIVIA
jgi:SAM-dependent methyltransferase